MPSPGDTFDRYVLEEAIGEGGMGRVYRALDPRLGRRVALKVLLAEGTDKVRADAKARMMREARAAAAFNHPNVVAIHDVGEVDGSPFIAMELVSGHTLRAYVGQSDATDAQKLSWLIDVARGLAAAHRAGLVHRDIKPDNVMVTADGVVKILDFGIARQSESDDTGVDINAKTAAAALPSLTAEGQALGTPQYMAPEQLQAEPVDGRCDQFAWGVMAWELFAGSLPWGPTRTGAQLIAAVLAAPVRPLREVAPSVSAVVSDVVARAVSKARTARFATMDELLASLEGKTDATLTQVPVPQPGGLAEIVTAPTEVQLVAPTTTGRGAMRTADPVPSVAAPVRRRRSWIGLAVLGVVAARLLWSIFDINFHVHDDHESRSRESKMTASNVSSAQATAPTAPLLGSCPKGLKTDCGNGTEAWCDVEGQEAACCAHDLVPTGKDGVCGCPPGGSISDASTCPRPIASEADANGGVAAVIAGTRGKFRACYNRALAQSQSLQGRMIVSVDIGPDGRVFKTRIKEGRMASPPVQTCVLDVLRAAAFPPPTGGTAEILVPITFVEKEAAPDDPGVPGRHLCKAKGSCGSDTAAWCDADEKELACCAPGLVAVGHDGMCTCPPGGIIGDAGSCPHATMTRAAWKDVFGKLLDPAVDKAMSCVRAADAGHALGGMTMALVVGPSGAVATARFSKGSLPQIFAQRCFLDAMLEVKGPPPPDGHGEDETAIDLGLGK